MTSSSPASIAERERAALADLLDELGPDAPTRCAGWTTAHLAAHLVVRDRRPDALPGYALEQTRAGRRLHGHSARLEDRLRTGTPYPAVVAAVRTGPPSWLPMGLPGLRDLANTAEYAIHHEDVRRAQPGWEPRAMSRADQDRLWPTVRAFVRRAAAGLPGALELRRSDAPGETRRIGRGEPVTTVDGEPLELLLWVSGRPEAARVTVDRAGDQPG